MRIKFTYLFGLLLTASVLISCRSTSKNPLAKGYHNLTALFNRYYNGELKYKEGVTQIDESFRVPEEGLIPAMYVGTEQDAKASGAIFEEAIKKAEEDIIKHPNSKWVDNCRFLMGRCWFYKQNYQMAIQNFRYCTEKVEPSKITPEVYLWLIRAYLMNGNTATAKKLLDEKVPSLKLKKRHRGELALIKAQIEMEDENYDEVVRILSSNKKNVRGKMNKARTYFLLGQLYAKQGRFSKSYESYKKVTKYNVDYDLVFNAQVRIARLFVENQEGTDETKKIQRLLKRMLRDEKNIEYKDRIYYEMALLDLKKQNQEGAISNLQNSIRYNAGNQRQKALSYYKIGQIYFYDKKDFKMAEAYFDSASNAITEDAPEYDEIANISSTLKEYITHLNTIYLQDSLIELAPLSDEKLAQIAKRVIQVEKAKEAAKQQQELERMNLLDDPNVFNQFNNQQKPKGGGSGFYYDQPQLVTQGRTRFQQLWGQRKNEDNWRRKNKGLVVEEEVATEDTVALDSGMVNQYGKEIAAMIANVPRTDQEIEARHQMIRAALYGLGNVYQNKLNLPDSAIVTYKRLIGRYPDSDYALKARYALFKLYSDIDPYLADEYKEKICRDYPDSRYCKLANNEVVAEEEDSQNEDFKSAYTALYSTYMGQDYATCQTFANFIATKYPTDDRLPNVYYIRGMAFGYQGKKDSLKKIFNYIRLNYPEAEITPTVIRTLAMMNEKDGGSMEEDGGDKGTVKEETKPIEEGIKIIPKEETGSGEEDQRYKGFVLDKKPNEKVYGVFLIDKGNTSTNDLQIKINDFNKQYFADAGLNASIFLYDRKYHLAYISQFEDYKSAAKYIKAAGEEESLKELFKNPTDKMCFITPSNFRTAYGRKRFPDYLLYFENIILKSLD